MRLPFEDWAEDAESPMSPAAQFVQSQAPLLLIREGKGSGKDLRVSQLPGGPTLPRRTGESDLVGDPVDSGETARLASVHREPLFRETAPAGPATGPRTVPTG